MKRLAASAIICAAIAATPAGALAAFPGTNGDIVFGRFIGEGGGRIFTLDPSNSAETELTPGGRICRHPSYSGDGERIAFSCLTGPMTSSSEIFTMTADGQDEVQVTQNSIEELDPSYSPDGRTIAFTRFAGNGDIATVGADGQNPTTLTATPDFDGGATFSPDGTKIAFIRLDASDSEIMVMNADGSNPTPLTDNTVSDGAPAFSPDGSEIVWSHRDGTDNDLWVMDANGENETPLLDTPEQESGPAYSPDGRTIVYSQFNNADSSSRLLTVDSNGQNPTPLTPLSTTEADLQPNWQPLNPPACTLTGSAKQKSAKQVVVTVECDENVAVHGTGELTAPKPRKRAVISKKKKVPLAPLTLEVAANTATTLTLTPATTKGRKLLKKSLKAGKKPKGTIQVTMTDDLGLTDTDTFAVKLKKKKKK